MERDKKGRFVKKGQGGLSVGIPPLSLSSLNSGQISLSNPLGEKIKYTLYSDGKFYDQFGKEVSLGDRAANPDKYEFDSNLNPIFIGNSPDIKDGIEGSGTEGGGDGGSGSERSGGINIFNKIGTGIKNGINNLASKPINKEKLANWLDFTTAGIAAGVNNKIADRALESEKPFLQDVSESHRSVYGNYRSQVEGEKQAAQLRNMASKPLTSDGALQQQMMMEAQIKGNEYINQGNAQDEAMIKQTREVAWQQEKENQQQRQAVAMQNRQAMMMSEKNKAQIENVRDSSNYSQVVQPLLTGMTSQIRQDAAEQESYQEYYDNALIGQRVWSDTEGLTPEEITMQNHYLNGTIETYLGTDENKIAAFRSLESKKNNRIIQERAALKGVSLNMDYLQNKSLNNPNGISWGDSLSLDFKSGLPTKKRGGTIYKARLTKRTRDNDRTAKSIESSKKIAAKFLEKALDSLYTYDDVELIAKPKNKKKKYQAGGNLPFVSFTPTFATSEKGASTSSKSEDKDDLTTKDILELLKDMDGLPSDMAQILGSLRNFTMKDSLDPLGLSSSSNIASQYIKIINKIKEAKFNREEYNQAFNQLKGNGGLSELAITSEGYLIGTKDGNFEYFTPEEIFNKEHVEKEYTLLTNSNLLYLRANSNDAAFNHKLITVAQNGIGIETINKLITDAITNLGTVTSSEEGYVKTKQGELIKGLDDFYKAVQNSDGNFNGTINDLYKGKFLTKSQAESAKKAISYIYNTLPTNARSLLKIKSDGSEEGALKLIETLITTKEDKQTQFDLELVGGKTHKTTNTTNKDNSDLESSLPLNVLKNIGGVDSYIDIDKGDGIHMSIRGTQFNQIKTPSGEPISDTSLSTMLQNSGLQSIVKDMRSIQFGDQKISPEALSFITYNNTGLTRANLPIKSDGSVNLDLLELYENAERDIELSGDKSSENIKSIYEQYGITSLLNADGTYNQSKFAPFIITEGYTTDALSGIQTSEFVREYQGNSDAAVALMQKSLAVGTGKNIVTPEVDEFSWYNPADWFGWTDTIFKGVIYIPITNNVNTAIYGANQNIDYDEALLQEEKYQNFEKMSDQRSTSADLLNI